MRPIEPKKGLIFAHKLAVGATGNDKRMDPINSILLVPHPK